jgi:uracil-DNA glycosylase family 4
MVMAIDRSIYDPDCTRCARLAQFIADVKAQHPDYFCKPVPPFGASQARLLVVGLAPGMHGANATGRPFTGDWCSDLLYGTLHRHGFASEPHSRSSDDGLRLIDCRLTNAVKCLPPANKPLPAEIKTCASFLDHEIRSLCPKVIVCLGAVAHDAVLRCLSEQDPGLRRSAYRFGHGAEHSVGGHLLIDSYHPSRYNTNTGRLTPEMFDRVFTRARTLIDAGL